MILRITLMKKSKLHSVVQCSKLLRTIPPLSAYAPVIHTSTYICSMYYIDYYDFRVLDEIAEIFKR